MKLTLEEQNEIDALWKSLQESPKLQKLKHFCHHHKTTTYHHVLEVTRASISACLTLPGKFDLKSVVRGAMLHDYYLYSRKGKYARARSHMRKHPFIACANANKDFGLNELEKDIVLTHMWPVTFFNVPRSKEAFIVSMMDKKVSIQEAFKKKKYSDPVESNKEFFSIQSIKDELKIKDEESNKQ